MMMMAIKVILAIVAVFFGLLSFLRIIQCFGLMEGEDSYDQPFPFLHLLVTVILIVIIIVL